MSIYRLTLAGAIVLSIVGDSQHLSAQAKVTIETVTKMKCDFAVKSTGNWSKEGEPSHTTEASKLSITYEDIDTQGGSAEIAGFYGKFFITVRVVPSNSLHLLQAFDSGPLYVTTVFQQPARPGKHKAAHSRHEYTEVTLPGFTSRPEQYVGECELLE